MEDPQEDGEEEVDRSTGDEVCNGIDDDCDSPTDDGHVTVLKAQVSTSGDFNSSRSNRSGTKASDATDYNSSRSNKREESGVQEEETEDVDREIVSESEAAIAPV